MFLLQFSLALLLCVTAFAQSTQPDASIGARPGAFSPRALGLGHTFLTSQDGAPALMGNPACLADQQSTWSLDLSADFSRVKETRSYPFYDAFDGVLGYNNYAVNDHVYSTLDGGVSYRVKQEQLDAIVLSAGTYSAYQFDYTYHEEVRNRFTSGGVQDLILGKNVREVEGDLRAVAFGAGARQSKMAMGFSVAFLSGDWGDVDGVYYASPDSANLIYRTDFSPSGTPADVSFGATYDVSDRVRLGTRALFPAGRLKYEYTTTVTLGDSATTFTGEADTKYPSHVAVGAQFRPQNDFRPRVYGEVELHTYSEVRQEFDDVVEFRAGIEQQVVPGTPARFGIVYGTSPSDKERASTLFTAGVGFMLRNMRADFGLEFGELNYTEDDLFPQSLYGEADRTDRDRIETSLFRGMISLSWDL